MVKGIRFDIVLSLLAISRSENFNQSVNSSLGWYHYEFRMTVVVRGMPAYWQHGREFQESNPASRACVTVWPMQKTSKK